MSAAMSEHGEQLHREMGEVAQTAKDQVVELRDTARTKLEAEVDRRRGELGTGARRVADATRETGQQLRDEGKELPAMLIERAAGGLDRTATYLEETDADQLWQDIRAAGRRKPWLFVVAGLAVGFAASRMIKAAGDDPGGDDPWSGHRPDAVGTRGADLGTSGTLSLPEAPSGDSGRTPSSSGVAGS